ncbi:Autophagy- protein 11 [Tyrophagus putrescentiae]|nr:Autophagy- protein 11 [Tyrophagus putrescentiae]
MLFIFLVNTGQLMKFKMDLALDTVENLKAAICEQHQIPVQSQVLLVSGGESLNLNDRVCKYSSAGTDTSPIFLFSKPSDTLPMLANPDNSADYIDENIEERVLGCLQMEPNFNTVACRAEMAHQLYEVDEKLYSDCTLLVRDQHYQQQGWAAVVANLEDIVKSFRSKAVKVEQLYNDILKNKGTHCELLESFESDKQTLARIPILKSLYAKGDHDSPMTLLDWIQLKDTKNSLDELYCLDELHTFDAEKLKELKSSIDSTIGECANSDMKEIRGLENRLAALDKLMFDAKKLFENQGILTKSFRQNSSRASEFRDISILPDLCDSQKEPLETMLKQHQELLGIKSRVFSAKNELSRNLHHRLRWIVHIEELLTKTDEVLVFYGLKLKKLREKMEILANLHLSPQLYLSAVVEVLRRRAFSSRFHQWSRSVSLVAREVIDAEVRQRTAFSAQLDKHFLKLFFPGMADLPEDFTDDDQLMEPIDQYLPQVTADDLEYLKAALPDMAAQLVDEKEEEVEEEVREEVAEEDEDEEEVDVIAEEPVAADTSMLESLTGRPDHPHPLHPLLRRTLTGSLEVEQPEPEPQPQPVECSDASMATSMTAKEIEQLASAKTDLESCLEEKNRLIEDLVRQLATTRGQLEQKEAYAERCTALNRQTLELTKSLRVEQLEPIRHLVGKATCKFGEDVQSARVALERLTTLQEAATAIAVTKNFEYSSTRDFAHSFISIPATPDSPKSSKDIEAITAKYKLPKNIEMITQNNEDKISVTSCEIGDNVLVYYEKTLENFIVFTLTGNLHYIHTDSLKDCDFGKDIQSNEFQWIIAKVLDKEYCQIKKEENRYKLPVNKKFYRVKVKQISKCNVSALKDTTDHGGATTANLVSRSCMPQPQSNRTLFGSIFGSIFGSSDPSQSSSTSQPSAFDTNN